MCLMHGGRKMLRNWEPRRAHSQRLHRHREATPSFMLTTSAAHLNLIIQICSPRRRSRWTFFTTFSRPCLPLFLFHFLISLFLHAYAYYPLHTFLYFRPTLTNSFPSLSSGRCRATRNFCRRFRASALLAFSERLFVAQRSGYFAAFPLLPYVNSGNSAGRCCKIHFLREMFSLITVVAGGKNLCSLEPHWPKFSVIFQQSRKIRVLTAQNN